MQTSSVVQNLGSSDTSRLHHAAKVQPPTESVIYLRCTVEKSVPHLPWLPTSPPGTVSNNNCDDITKATDDWKGLRITVELTIQNRQTQIEVVSSASALIIKALEEPLRERKKQETTTTH